MNTAVFFDTETTGFPLWNLRSDHPDQPHVVQLAAIVVNLDTRKTLSTMSLVVRPVDWRIPDDVAKIHGITNEFAMDVGVSEYSAVELFLQLSKYKRCIAHNVTFDKRILRIAQKRLLFPPDAVDEFERRQFDCTMAMSKPILNLPPTERMLRAGFSSPKAPNLSEAYKYFTGSDLVGAHDALIDVNACKDIYFAIEDLDKQG